MFILKITNPRIPNYFIKGTFSSETSTCDFEEKLDLLGQQKLNVTGLSHGNPLIDICVNVIFLRDVISEILKVLNIVLSLQF